MNAADPSLPPTYVEIKPISASAAQPKWNAENIDFLFGIDAQIRVTDVETRPDCPFPETLKLIPSKPDGGFALTVPLSLSFGTINEVLSSKLSGRIFRDDARKFDVEVRSLEIRPAGDQLLCAADVTVRKGGIFGFIDGRASGRVYLLAKPVVDPDVKLLRLQNARLEVDSARALSEVFGQVAAAAVENVVSREVRISYAKEIDKIKIRANAALAELSKKSGPVRLSIEMSHLNVQDVLIDKERLTLSAVTKGTVGSEVVKIGEPTE